MVPLYSLAILKGPTGKAQQLSNEGKGAKPLATKFKHDEMVKKKKTRKNCNDKTLARTGKNWDEMCVAETKCWFWFSVREWWLWYDSDPQKDNASSILPHKLRSRAEKRKCSFITTIQGHNHVITLASKSRGTPEPCRQTMRCQASVCLRILLQWRKR